MSTESDDDIEQICGPSHGTSNEAKERLQSDLNQIWGRLIEWQEFYASKRPESQKK